MFCQRLTPGAVLFNFIDENIVFGKIEKQICVYQVIFNIYQCVSFETDAQNEQNAISRMFIGLGRFERCIILKRV